MKPDFTTITVIRDLLQIREQVHDMNVKDRTLLSMEHSAAIVHLVNAYLDELLAPYVRGVQE